MGRPTSLTEQRVTKLEEAFLNGRNVTDACNYVGITRTAFYNNYRNNEEFRYRIDTCRRYIKYGALDTVLKASLLESEIVEKEVTKMENWNSFVCIYPTVNWKLAEKMEVQIEKDISMIQKYERSSSQRSTNPMDIDMSDEAKVRQARERV